jgi:hypothetical protein
MRFFELYVVLTFAVAWGILELVAKRLDKKTDQDADQATSSKSSTTESKN